MVFTNMIMTTHVNKTANQPPMNSMATKGYKSTYATNLIRGYQKPSIITTKILDHKNSHFVRPNKVVLKYLDFKKNVDLDVHVKVFNFAMKVNGETSEEYIINSFSYMLKDTTSNWCHNYNVKISSLYFFRAYTCILQISLENSK